MLRKKNFFLGLFDRICQYHMHGESKENLQDFLNIPTSKKWRGVVYLQFNDTKEMICCIKNNTYLYRWLKKNEALKLNHNGVKTAMTMMIPDRDCVLVCAIKMRDEHFYVNCIKIKDIMM